MPLGQRSNPVPGLLIGWDVRNAEQSIRILPELALIALDDRQLVSPWVGFARPGSAASEGRPRWLLFHADRDPAAAWARR